MKRLLLYLVALYFIPTGLVAQINFQTKSWKQVLAEAKLQHKLIFVDVYTDWCGPCKMLDRDVFSDKAVGKQFNSSFINYKANAERSGTVLAATYNVRAYPTGLFVDGDGQLVHSFVGYRPAPLFMHEGEQAMLRTPDGITMALQLNKFNEGDRTPSLVRSLLKLRRKYGQETNALLDDYLTNVPADSLNVPINRVIAYEHVSQVDSRAFELLVANKEDIRFRNRARIIVSQEITRAADNRDEKRLSVLLDAVEKLETERVDEQKAEYTAQFYEALKAWDRYAEQTEAFTKNYLLPQLTTEAKQRDSTAFWMTYNKLCAIGWRFYKDVKDEARLKIMTDYVRQANQLAETPAASGVCACLLYQMGQKDLAVQLQEKAVQLAEQTDDVDRETHKDRLKRMQKGKPL